MKKTILAAIIGVIALVLPANGQGTCIAPPSGLVSWWRGEGNSSDAAGSNHGTAQGGVGFAAGKAGQAFLLGVTNNGVRIPASTTLNVGTGVGMTVECWVKLNTVTGSNPLIEWNDGDGASGGLWGTHLFVGPFGAGSLYANIVGPGETWHQINSPAGVVKSNVFHHVALTYDKASGVARIFCDGAVVAQENIGSFTPLTDTDLYLGKRPAGDSVVNSIGLMDEVSLYNRALTTNEIAAIYQADSAGKCAPVVPVICIAPPSGLVSWWRGDGNSSDATGSNHGIAIGGVTYPSGKVGTGIRFNGSGAYLRVPHAPSLNFSNALILMRFQVEPANTTEIHAELSALF